MTPAAKEAERRRRARARKGSRAVFPPVVLPPVRWTNTCPQGGKHDWFKPNPRPADHKYECEKCGHYDLDDYQ